MDLTFTVNCHAPQCKLPYGTPYITTWGRCQDARSNCVTVTTDSTCSRRPRFNSHNALIQNISILPIHLLLGLLIDSFPKILSTKTLYVLRVSPGYWISCSSSSSDKDKILSSMEPEDPIIQHPAWLLYLIHKLYIYMNWSSVLQEPDHVQFPEPFSRVLSWQSLSAVVSKSILYRFLTVHNNSTHHHLQFSGCPQ